MFLKFPRNFAKIGIIFLLAACQVTMVTFCRQWEKWEETQSLEGNLEVFRYMEAGELDWKPGEDSQLNNASFGNSMLEYLLEERPAIGLYGKVSDSRKLKEYVDAYQLILKDISCFPVTAPKEGKESHSDLGFADSWGAQRNFGGERKHEGCDIMASNHKPGYYQVVSMTDGVVEQKGWLKLGGWRLGIRSPSGAYFYYAHLDSYADVELGEEVKSGQLLGYMGDSGYGAEGTRGQFPVHLHVGIYMDWHGTELSVNPYFILEGLDAAIGAAKGSGE